MFEEPGPNNHFHAEHVAILGASYRRWTGKSLVSTDSALSVSESLYRAPCVILSHNTEKDPIFNYANLAGQHLFEMSWQDFMVTPSRYSAEPLIRAERLRLFERVAEHGFIDDYRGVRISKTGRRFLIEQATVWTLVDGEGGVKGQAAMFSDWVPL